MHEILIGLLALTAGAGPARAPEQAHRVGEEATLVLRSPAHAVARKAPSPVLVWSEEIVHEGASYVAPHFQGFTLPPGAYAVVRSPGGERSWTYTGLGKEGRAKGEGFWGIHIPGPRALVEVWATDGLRQGAVEIDRYAHGYPGALEQWFPLEPESICGVDNSDWARCYQVTEPAVYGKARAVARLLIQGTGGCTGWLVGSAGHLITNQHCIGSASAALDTDYEFLAEGACGQNCASFGACPGTVVATSATLVRTNVALDYALVQLPTNPTGTYGFLQMRPAGASVNERIYIPGHPGAWGKRIALRSTHSSDGSGFCEVFSLNEPPCSGGPGDVGYFCDTEGGSSGSPVLAYSDHAVVSLHHCGGCANTGVPIPSVITDLGSSLPPNSTTSSGPTTVVIASVGPQDGRIQESAEDSNVGGTANGTGVLRLGDTGSDSQVKIILSFRTNGIPNGATILSAKLRLRRTGDQGTNPFTTHGTCLVDATGSGFSGSNELQVTDFEAPPAAVAVATCSNAPSAGDWSEATLNSAGLATINKGGRTQFRIYFTLDDDDDLITDHIAYASGDDLDTASHPQFVVTYQP